MSAPFKKLTVKKFSLPVENSTEDTRYWGKFKIPTRINEVSSIVSIHFSPNKPHDFAVTSSTYVNIYSAQTFKVKKKISRFENTAFSGNIRNDGKLLVAGDGNGLIQVFDLGSRAILRTFRGHKLPVHVTKFFPNNNKQVLSCSDDKTVRIWDIPGQGSISVLEGHKDYIRSGLISPDNPQIILSGSYDKTIKLWDLRDNKCNMTIDHGAPVEEVLMFPGGGIVLSAGGPTLNVWDMLAGGRLIRSVSNHQKTITTMCFDGSFSRLLTGSLDHHVKIYNVQNYEVVHSFTYPKPVLCISMSPDDTHLATGMTSGLLTVSHRKPDPGENAAKKDGKLIRTDSYQYFIRGYHNEGLREDFVIESVRGSNLAIYERHLKSFEYGKALDAVLKYGVKTVLTITMIQELIYRNGLRQALVNRDEVTLEPILKFVMRWINDPKYTEILIDVGNLIFEIYGEVVYQSPKFQVLLKSCKAKVNKELRVQKEIFKVIGSLEMLFAKNSIVSSISTIDDATSEVTNTVASTPTTSQ